MGPPTRPLDVNLSSNLIFSSDSIALKLDNGGATTLTRLEGLRARTKPLAFAVICGSITLDLFNVTGLTYDQVNIAQNFHIDLAKASWSLSAYSLTFGSFLLLAGRAGDVYGHKTIYSFGLLAFSLFSALIAGIPSSFITMCILRGLQGLSAACTVPTAYAIVARTYKGRARELAIAGVGVCTILGAIIGAILGGVFANSSIGYRGMLWLSFALSFICACLAFLLIPPTILETKEKTSLDYIGAFIVTGAATILVYGFTEGPLGWRRTRVIAPILIGAGSFVIFFIWENWIVKKIMPGTDPLIPIKTWSYPNLSAVTVLAGLMYGAFFLITLNGVNFLVRVQQHAPLTASLMFLPIAACSIIFILLYGPFYNHKFFPPKWMLVFAPFILLAGLLLFSRNDLHTPYWKYTFSSQLVISLGTSAFFVNYLNIIYASAPAEDQGLISGIIQTAAQISTAISFAIGGSFTASFEPQEMLAQYRNSFYVAIAFAGAAGVVALLFIRPVESRRVADDQDQEGSAIRMETRHSDVSRAASRQTVGEGDSYQIHTYKHMR